MKSGDAATLILVAIGCATYLLNKLIDRRHRP